jgi:hypothetical protein
MAYYVITFNDIGTSFPGGKTRAYILVALACTCSYMSGMYVGNLDTSVIHDSRPNNSVLATPRRRLSSLRLGSGAWLRSTDSTDQAEATLLNLDHDSPVAEASLLKPLEVTRGAGRLRGTVEDASTALPTHMSRHVYPTRYTLLSIAFLGIIAIMCSMHTGGSHRDNHRDKGPPSWGPDMVTTKSFQKWAN